MTGAEAFSALLRRRWSCRAFRPDPVPREVIAAMVDDAARVPTWNNVQPWGVIVTQPEETERFRQHLLAEVPKASPAPDLEFPKRYEGIYKQRRFDCAMQLYEAVGCVGDREASARQSMRNFALFDAPHVMILHSPVALGPYGALDCGAFATAFALAAEARGLGSIVQAALSTFSPLVRGFFDIPEDRMMVCAVSFGHPDPDDPVNAYRTPRAPASEVIDWR
ncbi:nitroreductase [Pseudaestuariivita atlantica]|uniref:Nitroreductase n=1 Tax=Pseudaestuariivita atlantica TaxID=1317121 RepID=A0A0L1JQR5_9RHOB|nr:nitroreductase [Pseudaestuariivita atlantica]KNG94129.1 nitroreductase [Pseudaestuariivita atlantica]